MHSQEWESVCLCYIKPQILTSWGLQQICLINDITIGLSNGLEKQQHPSKHFAFITFTVQPRLSSSHAILLPQPATCITGMCHQVWFFYLFNGDICRKYFFIIKIIFLLLLMVIFTVIYIVILVRDGTKSHFVAHAGHKLLISLPLPIKF